MAVTMKELLESGVHFGHQTRRWDPRMAYYIFVARNGIHIVDLQKTMQLLRTSSKAMKNIASEGGRTLFVGTKKQAKSAVVRHAEKCGMFYISERWPGGLLTNFETVRRSVQRLKDLEEMEKTGIWDAETKKEILDLQRELAKKNKMLSGIKEMDKLPDALFIIDPKRESIAVKEARKLDIPIFAVVDTNCNPKEIDFPIPGNDDAIRAIDLFLRVISDAIVEGLSAGQIFEDEESEKEDMAAGDTEGEKTFATTDDDSATVKEIAAETEDTKEDGTIQVEDKIEEKIEVAQESKDTEKVDETNSAVPEETKKAEDIVAVTEDVDVVGKIANENEKPEVAEGIAGGNGDIEGAETNKNVPVDEA